MRKRKILNVGCGEETYGTHFVDLYPSRENVIKCNVDEEELPFPNNYFDEVYSRNLLEHLKNPGFALKEMVRVLKSGGRLILVTDNASYLGFHFSFFGSKMHLGGYKGRGQDDKHFSLFTLDHLKNHLEDLNLKIERFKYEEARATALVKLIRKLISIFSERLAYPHIRVEARKI